MLEHINSNLGPLAATPTFAVVPLHGLVRLAQEVGQWGLDLGWLWETTWLAAFWAEPSARFLRNARLELPIGSLAVPFWDYLMGF